MKKIICFAAKDIHPAIWPNMMSLVDGFRALGHDVSVCDLHDVDSLRTSYDRILAKDSDIDFTVGFNGFDMVRMVDHKLYNAYEDCDVPHVSYMLDAIYSKTSAKAGWDIPCKKHIVTSLDRHAAEIPDAIGILEDKTVIFLPLGGTASLPPEEVFTCERPYDVVFSASVWNPDPPRIWHTPETPTGIQRLMDQLADRLEEEPISVWDAFRVEADARGYDVDMRHSFFPYLWPLLFYIKCYRRVKALSFLADLDIPVDVFGDGWEKAPFAKKLRLHGAVPYEEMTAIIGQAKVVCQDNAEFSNGAHDRVFTTMLNGAAVVSEYSTYLDEEFDDGSDIFLFDWKHGREKLAETIPTLLGDETLRLSAALRAYRKAAARHTWTNRAATIEEAVDIRFGLSK